MTKEEVTHMIDERIHGILNRIQRAGVWVNSKQAGLAINCNDKTLRKYRRLYLKENVDYKVKNNRGDVEYLLVSVVTKIDLNKKNKKL